VRRAQTLLNQGLVNDAIAAFQQALRSNPNSLEAKLGLAQAYQKAGRTPMPGTLINEYWSNPPITYPPSKPLAC
jgi:predicted Zn-dependent protease